jgi:outer membrane protein OmpA-like peptidoglycan-associated protein
MNFKKALLSAAAVVALPVLAQAQPVSGLYLGAGVGGNFLQGEKVTNTEGDSISLDYSWGYAGVLSLGWGYGNGLRMEIEGSYRQNDVSDFKNGNLVLPVSTGTVTRYGAMANILYDIDIGGALGGITPYVGVGAGYLWQNVDKLAGGTAGTNTFSFNGDGGSYAGQAIAGLSLPISAVPGLSLTAEYRFIAIAGNDVSGSTTYIHGGGTPVVVNGKSAVENSFNHSLLIGLRYAFNAAPVVAAAVAPIAAARTYLVFFDWSKADLTDRARQIIGEAATARGQGVTRIEVNGFTDRSGSDRFNQGLSERRANAVAAELVRRGVPQNEIVTRGFGEANPLIPTADGVREPQNRRVEIILR